MKSLSMIAAIAALMLGSGCATNVASSHRSTAPNTLHINNRSPYALYVKRNNAEWLVGQKPARIGPKSWLDLRD